MAILINSKTARTPGPDIEWNCPKCGDNSPANTYSQEEKMGLFYIPLITQRETCVECAGCGTLRLTRLPLHSLATLSANDLASHLYGRTSIIVQFLAVASLLLFCAPFVGLALGAIALVASLRGGGWPMWVSAASVCLSTLVSLTFLYLVLFG